MSLLFIFLKKWLSYGILTRWEFYFENKETLNIYFVISYSILVSY